MTFVTGRTSSPRSWTRDTSNWARSGWTSHGRDNRHDREQCHSPGIAGVGAGTSPHEDRPQGCAAKEYQDLRVPWRSVACYRSGALQLDRKEDAHAAGWTQGSAATADAPGQYRQQRAGLEEPAQG